MARPQRHPEGIAGEWYIDDRCIGCGASLSIAPRLIKPTEDGRQFVFRAQPATDKDVLLAQLAAEVCPTRSIRTESKQRWPPHHPYLVAPAVWRCGSNSPDTAGGNSYLIARPDGNVLVDGPRFSESLRRKLQELGGVALIALTHRDDVGDAQKYASAFGAEVVIHRADAGAAPFATSIVEETDPVELRRGLVAIPTPGHTKGHMMFLLDREILFAGDSLGWDPYRDDLWAEKAVCWHSWPEQIASLEELLQHRFTRVIPTHGALSPVLSSEQMHTRLRRLVDQLRATL